MNNGIKTNISAHFIQSVHEYGPSGFLRVTGNITGVNGKVVKNLNEPKLDVYLGQTKTVLYQDGEEEQIVNINQTYTIKEMEKWQANSINEIFTPHQISTSGRHTIRFRVLDPGIVLLKIMLDIGGLKPSYLGAPQSKETNER